MPGTSSPNAGASRPPHRPARQCALDPIKPAVAANNVKLDTAGNGLGSWFFNAIPR
jgi:hypothetical protein